MIAVGSLSFPGGLVWASIGRRRSSSRSCSSSPRGPLAARSSACCRGCRARSGGCGADRAEARGRLEARDADHAAAPAPADAALDRRLVARRPRALGHPRRLRRARRRSRSPRSSTRRRRSPARWSRSRAASASPRSSCEEQMARLAGSRRADGDRRDDPRPLRDPLVRGRGRASSPSASCARETRARRRTLRANRRTRNRPSAPVRARTFAREAALALRASRRTP